MTTPGTNENTARRRRALAAARTPPRLPALRPVSLAVCLLGAAPVAFALPTGAVTTSGHASVQQTAPGQMDILQRTARASLDWTSFSIAAGERVNVVQPDRSSVLLNRVVGNDPSLIYGALRSNGSVWLINPRGIVFGASSRVDVGGLVASTLSISGDALASGRIQLGAGSGDAGELRSEGQITAIDGSVVLAAPRLLHSGQIDARRVGLVAASEVLVDVEGDGLVFFNVRNQGLDTRLALLGGVRADGGSADIRAAARAGFADTVLNLEGVVQARSIGVREGRIVIDGGASGITRVAGLLDATNVSGHGGNVLVQGEKILLDRTAVLDASGSAGGGSVRVGGDFQGRNAEVRHARQVVVLAGAQLAANATDDGDGGRVIVWSDEATRFAGRADARGGAAGGDGGLVEVSGKAQLDFRGQSDRSAPAGKAGRLLLDPTNLEIVDSGPDIDGEATPAAGDLTSGTLLFGAPGTHSKITAGAVLTELGNGPVLLQATNDITVTQGFTTAATNTLTLEAGNSITVAAGSGGITTAGDIVLRASTPGITGATTTGAVTLNAAVTTGATRSITLGNGGGTGVHQVSADLGAGTLVVGGDLNLAGASVWTLAADTGFNNTLTGTAALTKSGAGTLTLGGAGAYTGSLTLAQGGVALSAALGSTNITVTGGTLSTTAADLLPAGAALNVASGGTLLLGGTDTVSSMSLGGNLAAGAALSTTGLATLSAGASVDAELNADTLAVTGNTTLNAAVAVAGNASVGSGVQLSVGNGGAAGSLLVTGTTTVDGTLVLNRDSALNATDLIGTGSLAGSGTLRQAGSGTVTLNRSTGTLARIDITGSGGLTLSGADRIGDSAAVTVGSGATFTTGADPETVGSLTLAGGTLAGGSALTAGAVSSSGSSSLAAPLTAHSLTVTGGTLTLSAALTSNSVIVDAGTLATSGADLLADTAAVDVVNGASLSLGGNDSIATLALGGNLGGAGALTTSGAATLSSGATVDTALNAASLLATGSATLTADVAVAGTTSVNAGTLRVGSGSTGSLTSTGTLTVAGGATLEYNRSGSFSQNGIAGSGTLKLTAGTMTLTGAAADLVTVQVDGGSLALSGAGNKLDDAATLTLNGGSFSLANNVDETVGNVGISGTLAAAGTARLTSSTGSYALGAGAQVNGNLGAGTVDVTGSGTATLNADVNANTVNVNGGATLALGAAAVLSNNANVAVLNSSGRLTLGSNQSVRTLALAGTLSGAFRISTSNGTTLNTNAVVEAASEIAGSEVAVNGDATLAGRIDANLRVNNGGTLQLTADRPTATPNLSDHIADNRNVNLRSGSSIQLTVNEKVNQVTGSGTRVGPGVLNSTIYYLDGDSVGNLDTDELVSDGLSSITGTVTVSGPATVNTGTLTVGSGNNGSLSAGGGITVNAGAVLAFNRSNTAVLASTVSGLGTLRQAGSGELQITGVTNLPIVEVTGGTMSLAAGNLNRLSDSATVTIGSGLTLRLDNASETVATLNLNGTLAGTGVLTAGTYNLLSGSTVNAALGAGAIEVSGASALNRAAAAATVAVRGAGALTLSASGSLSSAADVLVEAGGTLTLAANTSVNRLSAGGRLAGSGFTLTAGAASNGYTLTTGGLIDANLGSGTLTVNGNATLNGSTQTATLNLAGGTLVLGGSGGRLANAAMGVTIDAAAGSGLTLSGAESVASFSSAGTLGGGANTLTASGALTLLNGAAVNVNIAGATVSASGNVALSRTLTAATASLTNSTLSGSGTLSAGSTTLQGSITVTANLGGGSLNVASGSATLAGTVAADTLDVVGGAGLTLASAGRLTQAPMTQIAGSVTLTGNETVGSLAGSGTLALGSATLTTGGRGSSFFNGSIGGSGNLTKVGVGTTFALGGSQGYTGVTTVSQGTLQLANGEVLADGSSVVVAGPAVLALAGLGSSETINTLTLSGTLAGTGRLQAGTYNLTGGNTTASTALGTGQIVATGNSTLAGTAQADVRVDSGRLTLASAGRLVNATAAVDVRSGAALTLAGAENVGGLTLAGTLDGAGRLTAPGHTLQTGAVVNANLGGGAVTVAGNATLAGNAQVTAVAVNSGATLTLGATPDRIVDSATLTLAAGGGLVLGGDESVASATLAGTLSGSGSFSADTTLATGALVQTALGGATLRVTGNSTLNATAAATTLQLDSGTLVLGSAHRLAPNATVTVATPATLQIGGDEGLRQLNLSGALNGATGTLTANAATGYLLSGGTVNAALGIGAMSVSSASSLNASVAAGNVGVLAGGTLTLGASGQFTAAPLVSVAATGALVLGSDQTFGSLAGSGSIGLGSHTLRTGNAGNTGFDGVISGGGGLVKQGSGSFSLGGSQAYGGVTRVAQGTLALQSADVLSNTSAAIVDSGATLALGGADTVVSLTLSGTLAGAGTLTTSGGTTLLAGAATGANANLGAGTLTVLGNSTLAGSTAAGVVNVTSGNLTLASADRLADTAAVTVAAGAGLALNGNDSVGSLALAGSLTGVGHTLTAAIGAITLHNGASVSANLGAGTLNVAGNATLSGTAASGSVNVDAGSFTLTGAGRLGAGANLAVRGGAALLLGGDETVGSLTLAGTLGTAGRKLTATTYTLEPGAQVTADLGAGTLTVTGTSTLGGSGDSTLTGTADAALVNLDGGRLVLGTANRLSDNAAVTVASLATLRLNGNDKVRSLTLSGVLDGTGTLTADNYVLNGGTYNAPLGDGELTSTGATTLNATSAARVVTVSGGTLTLGAANRFTAVQGPALTVAGGAVLNLGGNETFGTLAGAGTVGLGIFTLTSSGVADATFSGSLNGSGGLTKQGSTTFTLSGASSYTGSTRVEGGTLALTGTLASLDLQVTGGTLALGSADRLDNNAGVTVATGAAFTLSGNDRIRALTLAGRLAGTGTLEADNVVLNGGRVDADLGGGSLVSTASSLLNGTSAATVLAVNGGTLTLAGDNRLTAAPSTTVSNGATLALQGATTLGSLAGAGEVALGSVTLGSHTLTTGGRASSQFDGVLSGSGGLSKTGSSSFTMGGQNSYAGATRVLAGTLATASADRLPNGSAVDVATGATLTLGGSDTVASLHLSGTLGGTGTLQAASYSLDSGTVNTELGTGTLSSAGTSRLAAAAAAGTVGISSGTLTLAAGNLLADAAVLTVASGATLALGGNDRVTSLSLAGRLAGSGTLTADIYTLISGQVAIDAKLGAGALASSGASELIGTAAAGTVVVNGGTLSLAAAGRLVGNPAVTVAPAATLALLGDEAVTSLALAGTLGGSGTLTATTVTLDSGQVLADLGRGTLTSNGSSLLAGRSAATTLNVDSGTLALASGGRLSAAPVTTLASGATLALGGNEALGTLAGAGSVTLGSATLGTGTGGGNSRFDGVLSGTGGLTKTGSGTLTLGGTNTYTGVTTVQAGTLATAAADVLPDRSPVTVASGATLALGGNDTVFNLLLSGSLDGSSTLTAGSYTLNGGTARANLGTGGMTTAGSSLLSGTSGAAVISVVDGTLTLAGAGRLAANASVAVIANAILLLGGDENIGALNVAGTLGGSGTLTAAAGYALAGGTVDANLGIGTLSSGFASRLNGRSAAQAVTVNDGTLTLGSAGRLLAAPAVTLDTGATLQLGGDETLGTLAGSGNLNLGAATLRSGSGGDSSYGGVMTGSGGFVKQGGSGFTLVADQAYTGATTVDGGTLTLAGTLATGAVQVIAGTLALAAPERLPDGNPVAVAAGARLSLAGNEKVASLALAGTLTGSGTLDAVLYTLDGGTAEAHLGTGTLQSTGNSRLDGSAAVTTLTVNGGTLTLGSADRLSARPATTVAGGAALQLEGSQTLGTLAGAGNVQLGTHTVRTGAGGATQFDGTLAGDGSLVKQGDSVFTLAGSQTYRGATRVEAGTLALAAANLLADASSVDVAAGAVLRLAGDDTVASLTLAGLLTGSGTLNAATYTLAGGRVETELGHGALRSSGDSTLVGSAAVGSVNVTSGQLTLAGADRLRALPAVDVAAGARLQLGGDEAFGTLSGAGTVALADHGLRSGNGGDSRFDGRLEGSGGLVKQGASVFTLAGDQAYTGGTRVEGGTLAVAGTLATGALQVTAGTLSLLAADRLADAATVDVLPGAAFTLAGNDSIASLTLAGLLDGSGTLSAASYSLNGGRVVADLGSGSFTSRGSSRLDGRAAASTVVVTGGTLTLGAADRLADSAAVTVATGATLVLDSADTVASLALAGTLSGSGTLSAAGYTLDSGTANANLGAGALSSRGNSVLAGTSAAGNVTVQGGTLTLASAQRLSAAPAVQLEAGATLAIAGDQLFGTLAGSGRLELGSFTFSTGGGGDSSFAGVIGGSGGLVKQGSSSVFTLTGTNTYTGATQVAAGTLRLGDGSATAGSLATSAYTVEGLLELARADDVTLSQAVSGSGGVRQSGSGRVLFSGNNKTYTGDTTVARGELVSTGADELPDASAVVVASEGRLTLGGRETLRRIDADGAVSLAGDVSASGDLLLRGPVATGGPLLLSGERITAVNAGNRFGGALSIDARGAVTLAAGSSGGGLARDLVLGSVRVADGGRIEAGRLTLGSETTVNGGTLQLLASATPDAVVPAATLTVKQATALPIAWAGDAVLADTGSRIAVAAGAALDIVASGGGSVRLLDAGNNFLGGLSVVSGVADAPWSVNATSLAFGGGATQNYAVQSRVQVNGLTVNVGGAGIVADVVALRADRVATVGSTATLVARLPYDSAAGTVSQLPGLTLELTPAAYELSFPFGAPGADGGLRANVGSRAYGDRTLPLDAGYVTVLPRDGARGTTAVLLLGPTVNPAGGYRFFFDGAGRQTEIPVFYNGVLPTTPQVENSLSAAVAVSEGARKERFDEAVRTENVAVRLRAGVIAEVGPAPSATQGSDGLRVPPACTPLGSTLGCSKAP